MYTEHPWYNSLSAKRLFLIKSLTSVISSSFFFGKCQLTSIILHHDNIRKKMYEFLWVTLTLQHIESHHDFTPLRLSFDLLLIFLIKFITISKKATSSSATLFIAQQNTLTQFPTFHSSQGS